MRGEVLHYDEIQGFGFIAGADGNRYAFARENLRRGASARNGALVEFRESGGRARDVVDIRPEPAAPPPPAPAVTPQQAAAPVAKSVPPPIPAKTPTAAESSPHFGRSAIRKQRDAIGLWGYFWRGMTSNYANFRGRARRKEYWGFHLFFLLALAALSLLGLIIDFAPENLSPQGEVPAVTIVIVVAAVLAMIVPSIAMMVRRQHDIGLPGWFILVVFLPFGSLVLLVFSLIPSQKRDNRWGPVPPGIDVPAPFMPPQPEIAR